MSLLAVSVYNCGRYYDDQVCHRGEKRCGMSDKLQFVVAGEDDVWRRPRQTEVCRTFLAFEPLAESMTTAAAAALINLLGFVTGAALYTMLLVMVLSGPRSTAAVGTNSGQSSRSFGAAGRRARSGVEPRRICDHRAAQSGCAAFVSAADCRRFHRPRILASSRRSFGAQDGRGAHRAACCVVDDDGGLRLEHGRQRHAFLPGRDRSHSACSLGAACADDLGSAF